MDRSIKASKQACFEITEFKILKKKNRLERIYPGLRQDPDVAPRDVNIFTHNSSESDTLYPALDFIHQSIINTPELKKVLTPNI